MCDMEYSTISSFTTSVWYALMTSVHVWYRVPYSFFFHHLSVLHSNDMCVVWSTLQYSFFLPLSWYKLMASVIVLRVCGALAVMDINFVLASVYVDILLISSMDADAQNYGMLCTSAYQGCHSSFKPLKCP